jgi:hypothetical protein
LKTHPCFLLLHYFPPSLTPDTLTDRACFRIDGSFNSQVFSRAQLIGYLGGSVIFPRDPLTYVRRAMQQFNAPCFTSRQKPHRVKIDEHHLLKV